MLEILYSGCAVAEFKGTYSSNETVLKNYAYSRNHTRVNPVTGAKVIQKANKRLGVTNAHNVVIMSSNRSDFSDIKKYIHRHRLGKAWLSVPARNINHTGWHSSGQSEVIVLMYQPDHDALTKWVKRNFDKNYELT